MKYRVAFEKRSRADGQQSALDPTLQLEDELDEGIVAEKTLVEWLESEAQHNQEVLDEDDAFLGFASAEVWEYDVVAGRNAEFESAMQRSKVVLEYTVVDETDTPPEDVTIAAKPEPEPIPAGTGDATESDIPEPHPMEAAQTLDELQVRDAGDPNLGMTYSDSERDWAANTGPSRNSGGGTHTRHLTDKSSTLRP